ncbi:MAG TPA: hypothetical protein VK886_18685 [Vicinamibacterales bacterium]|nr:hypothetical protein [Vicinamibacterales bacterium]
MAHSLPCRAVLLAGAALVVSAARPATAQYLPSSPIALAGGRIVIGGDIAASIGPRDEEGWFNYTDYEHDALRLFRVSVAGEWRIARRLSVLGELRSENVERPQAYAAYVRVRPFANVPLDVQGGRIPPTFGAFGRRVYSNDNPLIGYPLAYQYLLSIRPDAIPETPDDLLRMRARGWQPSFPLGSAELRPGVPVMTAFEWDTGIQVRAGPDRAQVAMAVTNGSLSAPRFSDDNGGKQVAARAQFRPLFGLVIGASAARGAWLSREIEQLAAREGSSAQQAIGVDVEYSWGYWILRGEAIRSTWTIPTTDPDGVRFDLSATTGWIEGRYRLTPRLYLAGRADRLTFSTIAGSLFGGAATAWDAPVTRLEVGGGWYLQRNLVARAAVQRNWRDGGRKRERTFLSGQLLFWF